MLYAYHVIDPRLILHWQGTPFYLTAEFLLRHFKRPGRTADLLQALLEQGYESRFWGSLLVGLQVAVAVLFFRLVLKELSRRRMAWLSYPPAALLLAHATLYYDRTPFALGLSLACIGGIAASGFLRRLPLPAAWPLLLALLTGVYFLADLAIVFLAPLLAVLVWRRNTGRGFWSRLALALLPPALACLLPWAVEKWHWLPPGSPAKAWFVSPEVRRQLYSLSLYSYVACLVLLAAWLGSRESTSPAAATPAKAAPGASTRRLLTARIAAAGAVIAVLLACGWLLLDAGKRSARDRRLAWLDYYCWNQDWASALAVASKLEARDFNELTRYQVNLALHETGRLGNEMFRFPQSGPPVPALRVENFVPYMVAITDLCLRLGRVNEAIHFGNESLILASEDPRVLRLMATAFLVKGEFEAAKKFLRTLAGEIGEGRWAREYLRKLETDPDLKQDDGIQALRRRMLRINDMIVVWQRASVKGADMERLFWNQLGQDPGNRTAFDFLAAWYLQARRLHAFQELLVWAARTPGATYGSLVNAGTLPRHFQEALAILADLGESPAGFPVRPEVLALLDLFKRIVSAAPTRDAAAQAAWDRFGDSYFYYYFLGPGGVS